jgi:DNA recombination protein RmuC
MSPTLVIAVCLITAMAGFAIGWFAGRSRISETQGKLSAREDDIRGLNDRIGQMNARIDQLNEQLRTEAEKRASAETRARLLEDAKTVLSDTFKALSDEALKSNNDAFLKLARSSLETFQTQAKGDLTEKQKAIETLVQPLKESLERYEKQLTAMDKDRHGQYQSLADQVKSLIESEKSLKDETGKLVTALSKPQVRGHWGEITLRRVVELAGMVEHCDFIEQESTDTPQGRIRPDMIVNLPNNRKIVVDAKAPLKAYIEAVESADESARSAKILEHAHQVKSRVRELSRKEYWDQFDEAPEFVVLFLPGEQFLGAALEKEPDLLEDAFKQRVVPATPTTLISLLKAVAYGWRQEQLTENAQKISELGKQLYDRISTLANHMQELGRKLDGSVSSYNKAIGSLEGRVLISARKFKELGATGAEDIPIAEPIDQSTRKMIPMGFEVVESEDQPPHPA